MKTTLYGIWDTVTGDFTGPIMRFAHDAPAVRTFNDIVNNKDTQVAAHPDDYALVALATLTHGGVEAADATTAPRGNDIPIVNAEMRFVITGAAIVAAREANNS